MLIGNDVVLRKRILTTAGPAMVEMIMYMVIGVVDIAVVGRLGAAPLAAVSLGSEIFFSLVLFLEALAVGSTVLAAQAKGADNLGQIRSVTAHTLVIGIVLGLLVQQAGLAYTSKILGLFSVEASVFAQARSYLLVTFQVAPFALILYMINSVFRGLGRTNIPMLIALVMNLFNVIGDYVLVYGLWGFPALGVEGAAVATSAAHVIGFILAVLALVTGQAGIRLRMVDFIRLRIVGFKEILTLGIPSLLEQFFHTTSHMVSIYLLVFLGTVSFATHQLAVTVESISFMPGFGMGIAATALVGQAIGAKNLTAAHKAARGCWEMALIIMGFFALVFALAPGLVASLFTNDKDIIDLSKTIIRIASLEQLTIAFSMTASGILKGSGDTRTPMWISSIFTWLFRLPLMFVLVKILSAPLAYIWMLFVADWLLRTIIYLIIYRRGRWLRGPAVADKLD